MRSKPWIRVLALTVAFVCTLSSLAAAADDFRLDWWAKNYPNSNVDARLDPEGAPVFTVNTLPIPTYSDQGTLVRGTQNAWEMWFRARFNGALFRIGANPIAMVIGTHATHGVRMDNRVYLRGPQVDRLLFQFGLDGSVFTGTTTVTLSLREIDPQLADSIEALRRAIEDARRRLAQEAIAADERNAADLDRLAALDALLDDLLDRGWDGISPDELDALLEQFDDLLPGVREALVAFLEDLRRNVDDLRREIERISEVYQQQAEAIDDIVGAAPTWDPSDESGFEPVEDGDLPPTDIPEVFDEPWDDDHDPYRLYADEIIASLARTVSQDGSSLVVDRPTFLSIYEGWRYNVENLELVLQMRSVVSQAEWGAFLTSKTRVLGFLRHYIGDDGWLHRAYVPPEVKELVAFLKDLGVASRFYARARSIQLELNLYGDQLTERQRAIVDILIVLYSVTRERASQQAPDEDDGFWSTVGDALDTAISFTPVGDFLDLCRAVGGREDCIGGRELTLEERALSGLGVVVGSGAAWKAAASKVSGVAGGAVRKVGDVLDDLPPRRPQANIVQQIDHAGGSITYVHANGWRIKYGRRGFPDFSPYMHPDRVRATQRITLTGSRRADFREANRKAGFGDSADATPDGYTWHHHEDLGKMQLVRTDVHRGFAHNGGVAVWQRVHGREYAP